MRGLAAVRRSEPGRRTRRRSTCRRTTAPPRNASASSSGSLRPVGIMAGQFPATSHRQPHATGRGRRIRPAASESTDACRTRTAARRWSGFSMPIRRATRRVAPHCVGGRDAKVGRPAIEQLRDRPATPGTPPPGDWPVEFQHAPRPFVHEAVNRVAPTVTRLERPIRDCPTAAPSPAIRPGNGNNSGMPLPLARLSPVSNPGSDQSTSSGPDVGVHLKLETVAAQARQETGRSPGVGIRERHDLAYHRCRHP